MQAISFLCPRFAIGITILVVDILYFLLEILNRCLQGFIFAFRGRDGIAETLNLRRAATSPTPPCLSRLAEFLCSQPLADDDLAGDICGRGGLHQTSYR